MRFFALYIVGAGWVRWQQVVKDLKPRGRLNHRVENSRTTIIRLIERDGMDHDLFV